MPNSGVFDAGYGAYWDGIDRKDNPHDPEKEPKEQKSWLDGWRKARGHDYDECEK